jgi:hypothetical protein
VPPPICGSDTLRIAAHAGAPSGHGIGPSAARACGDPHEGITLAACQRRTTPDLESLRAQFAAAERWFHDSPLYRTLSAVVARENPLLELAAHARAGQQPTNLLMAATHMVVARDPSLPFARFFATIAGPAADPPTAAGAEYPEFCAAHRDALTELLETRLVQTNEPARATAIRYALHEVGRRAGGPVTFLEVGPSAGV